MDPIRPLFFNSAFDLHYEGMSLNLRGLISLTGITRIFVSVGIPDSWVQALGKIVIVKVEGVEIEGALLQQMVEHGSFYEVKFVNLSDQVKTYLETRLQRESVHPGWQRKFPRISVNGYEDPDLPVPNLCMVRFVGQEIFVNVINFTLGGIRIETLGDALGELKVGSVLHFDLVTSTGEILTNLSGEVRNIATQNYRGTDGNFTRTRSFGLRLLPLSPDNEKKYRNLIRDYCLTLQKKLFHKGEQ